MNDIHIEVTSNRMAMAAQASSVSPTLRDLALGTLTILEHTPLTAVGLNLRLEFRMDSLDSWHALGNRIVPKGIWSTFLDNPDTNLAKVSGPRPDCSAEKIEFTIGPSSEIKFGVAIAVNQHYNLENVDDLRSRHLECRRILRDDWVPFVKYVSEASNSIVNSVEESPE